MLPLFCGLACGTNGDGNDAGSDVGIDASTDAADANLVSDAVDEDPCAIQPYGPTLFDACVDYHRLPCGLDAEPRQGCYFTYNDCLRVCTGSIYDCHAIDDSCRDGSVVESDSGLKLVCSHCF
jgi:hypothetical protein